MKSRKRVSFHSNLSSSSARHKLRPVHRNVNCFVTFRSGTVKFEFAYSNSVCVCSCSCVRGMRMRVVADWWMTGDVGAAKSQGCTNLRGILLILTVIGMCVMSQLCIIFVNLHFKIRSKYSIFLIVYIYIFT